MAKVTKKPKPARHCPTASDPPSVPPFLGAYNLDKLAQLPQRASGAGFSGLEKLQKRAKAKYFTMGFVKHLVDLESPLKKSYLNTYIGCCDSLHQRRDKITSKYCNNRWCIVCNRIRIAKCINGYMPELKALSDPQFLTLTIPNVIGGDLRASIKEMTKTWQNIYKKLKEYRKMKLRGIRKIECTYNPEQDTYHPHFHLIVDGADLAGEILNAWLDRWPAANRSAQDIRPADSGAMVELFKYFTKVITKQSLYIAPLDVIFQAMRGLRTFQPFGITAVSEDVDQLQAEVIDQVTDQDIFWQWMNHDWIESSEGRVLTGFKPSKKLLQLLENVILT